MSTEQDSVRRLAEIRAAYERADDFTRARMDNVKWMLDLIDSLTAERDHERHRKEVAEFEREEVRTALTSAIEAADAPR